MEGRATPPAPRSPTRSQVVEREVEEMAAKRREMDELESALKAKSESLDARVSRLRVSAEKQRSAGRARRTPRRRGRGRRRRGAAAEPRRGAALPAAGAGDAAAAKWASLSSEIDDALSAARAARARPPPAEPAAARQTALADEVRRAAARGRELASKLKAADVEGERRATEGRQLAALCESVEQRQRAMLDQADRLAAQERQLAARLAAVVAQQDRPDDGDDDDFAAGDRPFAAATLVEAAALSSRGATRAGRRGLTQATRDGAAKAVSRGVRGFGGRVVDVAASDDWITICAAFFAEPPLRASAGRGAAAALAVDYALTALETAARMTWGVGAASGLGVRKTCGRPDAGKAHFVTSTAIAAAMALANGAASKRAARKQTVALPLPYFPRGADFSGDAPDDSAAAAAALKGPHLASPWAKEPWASRDGHFMLLPAAEAPELRRHADAPGGEERAAVALAHHAAGAGDAELACEAAAGLAALGGATFVAAFATVAVLGAPAPAQSLDVPLAPDEVLAPRRATALLASLPAYRGALDALRAAQVATTLLKAADKFLAKLKLPATDDADPADFEAGGALA
ncbi:hypothetical protein JL721_10247 [Aureococcus anophagefferens]|nr:hypothetical protein JL721_10247 [Aureococcus anophagefferens]